MPTDNDDNNTPPEGLILFVMIGLVLGGTLIINWIVNLFIPGLY